uniref:C2H2-type domain-containing protein n=1 Tax=Romanomermis culicivorax TaxID=13658 RepID=A0A915KKP8_ROMCU
MHNCPICQKYFTHDGNLQAHIKAVHYGEKRQRRTNKFKCEICFKSLCSKRSYDEHKNTHFNCRPFKCSMCPYAAASQMTLRRHNLRQHVSKKDWHYRCPYCPCAFVEPTSYQSHIQHKHAGLSGTFGCDSCSYSTLSSKIFLQHILKHSKGEIMPSPSFHQSSPYAPVNNFGQQPIKFDSPSPQFFIDQSSSSISSSAYQSSSISALQNSAHQSSSSSSILTLENAHQVPAVGVQQIVTSSPATPFSLVAPPPFLPSTTKNSVVVALSQNHRDVNRYLIDDDLGEGYRNSNNSNFVKKQIFSTPPAATSNNDDFVVDEDDDDTDGSAMLYDLMDSESIKFAQNGIPGNYFHRPKIANPGVGIKLEPEISDPNPNLSLIPEACFQVEIESSFSSTNFNDLNFENEQQQQLSIFKTTTMAKDLGNDVLPDGQVDFDLD